ncbi:MAG: hypothetical protein ACRCWJ_16390, partial [Casimicrobium sp.]
MMPQGQTNRQPMGMMRPKNPLEQYQPGNQAPAAIGVGPAGGGLEQSMQRPPAQAIEGASIGIGRAPGVMGSNPTAQQQQSLQQLRGGMPSNGAFSSQRLAEATGAQPAQSASSTNPILSWAQQQPGWESAFNERDTQYRAQSAWDNATKRYGLPGGGIRVTTPDGQQRIEQDPQIDVQALIRQTGANGGAAALDAGRPQPMSAPGMPPGAMQDRAISAPRAATQTMPMAGVTGQPQGLTEALNRALSGSFDPQYMDAQASAITNDITRNFQENVMPSIRQSSIASGSFGGSGEGISS